MLIQTPQNSISPLKAFLFILASHAIGFLESIIDAAAEHFLDWLLSQDWTVLIECSQAWASVP